MKIKDLFKDWYTIINLTDNYSIYLECLNADKSSFWSNTFDVNKVKYIMVELNDKEGNVYFARVDDNISLETTLDDLKKYVFDTIMDELIKGIEK